MTPLCISEQCIPDCTAVFDFGGSGGGQSEGWKRCFLEECKADGRHYTDECPLFVKFPLSKKRGIIRKYDLCEYCAVLSRIIRCYIQKV
jgi:hypothetical protein